MKNIYPVIFALLVPIHIFAGLSNAQYSDLSMEFGAIDAGSAGAFSTTNPSIYSVDNNPALLVLGYKYSFTSNYYQFNIIEQVEYYYNSVSANLHEFAFGLSYYDRKFKLFPTQAYSFGLSSHLTKNSTIGITLRYIHSRLSKYDANNLCFGIGYYSYNNLSKISYKNEYILKQYFITKYFKNDNRDFQEGISFGLSLRNLGPNVVFIDVDQGDPLPQEINLGLSYSPIVSNLISIKIGYDLEKDLVASFPDRDIDGNGIIGGYDKNGDKDVAGVYSHNGKIENAHNDKWYRSLITSWADDWFLLYDSGTDGIKENDKDGKTNDGSFKAELESITNHFGIDISLIGLFGFKFGKILNQFGDRNVNCWGFYVGPDFLRYHFSNNKWNHINSNYKYNIEFHTVEFNYTPVLNKIIEKFLK